MARVWYTQPDFLWNVNVKIDTVCLEASLCGVGSPAQCSTVAGLGIWIGINWCHDDVRLWLSTGPLWRRDRCASRTVVFKLIKPAKNKFSLDLISRVFHWKFQKKKNSPDFFFRLNYTRRCLLKNCQTVADIRMMCQFHEFFAYHFWWVFNI